MATVDSRGTADHAGRTIPYRTDIDGLRAVAVVLVVLYHAGVPGFAGGYVGVDVFFVISGFLITSVIVAQGEADRFSILGFYAGRVRRLLPLSLVTLVTTVVFGAWLLPSTRAVELVDDARAVVFYVANWRFADKSVAYVDTQVSDSMLTHYWSLSIEEQFYFLWPVLMALAVVVARRLPGVSVRFVAGVTALVVTVVSLAMSIALIDTEGTRAYNLTHLRLWEIGFGAIVATALAGAVLTTGVRYVVQFLALASVGISAVWYDDETPFPGSAALLPVAATAALLVVGGSGNRTDAVLSSRPARYIGDRSFAWYLWHWPALGVAKLLDDRYGLDLNESVRIGCAVAISFILAIVTHRWVENPIRFARPLRRFPKATIAVALGSMVTLFVAMSGLETRILRSSAQVWAEARVTPEQAVDDTASAEFDACHNAFGQDPSDEVVVWCEAGDPDGDRTVVLVGDSHAQHWAPAFDAAGKANGWRVLVATRSSCLVYDVAAYNARLELMDDGCRRWGRAIESAIADEGGVDLVAVGRARGYVQTVRADDGSTISEAEAEALLRDGVDRFLTVIADRAASVMIIEDTPWASGSIPDCLLAVSPQLASSCDFEAVTTSLEVPMLAAERSAVESFGPSASVVSLDDLVCPGGTCATVDPDGQITFRDQHHMTATYSRSLGDQLSRVLRPLVER